MTTINAQTIINEVMDAYAVAPSEHNEHQNNYACYWPKFAPWGFEDLNESTSEYPTSAENAYRDLIYDLMTDATSEINDLFMVPTKIKFQTSERGFHTVRNIKANLKNFADLVRKNASAFGGGLIKAQKQRAAVSWPAQSIALFKQSIEDGDFQAAFDIGEQKLGALYFISSKGKAFMQVAPVPCDFEPRVVSVCNENGTFAVIEPVSMCNLGGLSYAQKRNRSSEVQNVIDKLASMPSFDLESAITKQLSNPVNQELARAQWMAEHGLDDDRAIQARIDEQARIDADQQARREARQAEKNKPFSQVVADAMANVEAQTARYMPAARETECEAEREAMARQDVAQVVAQALTTIAITEAMADTSEDTRELATCEAGESEASAPTAGRTSWAPTPQYVPPSLSQIKPGAPVPPAYRGGMDDTDPPSDGNAKPTTRPVESTEEPTPGVAVKEYRYALVNRPLCVGTAPKEGFLRIDARPSQDEPHHAMSRHGIAVYSRQLSDKETKDFELAPIADGAMLSELCAVVYADMVKYADGYIRMASKRWTDFQSHVMHTLNRLTASYRVSIPSDCDFADMVLKALAKTWATDTTPEPEPTPPIPPVAPSTHPVAEFLGNATPPVAEFLPVLQTYQLPETDAYADWSGAKYSAEFTPNARQQMVIDAVQTALDEGKYYTADVLARCIEILNIDSDTASMNYTTRVEGGIVGMDCYYAREYIKAKAEREASLKTFNEMALREGDELGILVFTDYKRTTGVKITEVSEGGSKFKFTGKRGAYTVSGTGSADQLKCGIERAFTTGKRKTDYAAFLATQAKRPTPTPPVVESQPDTHVMETETPQQARKAAIDSEYAHLPEGNRPPAFVYGEGLETWQMDASTFSKQSRDNPHWTQSYTGGDGDYLRDCYATHAAIVAAHEAQTAPAVTQTIEIDAASQAREHAQDLREEWNKAKTVNRIESKSGKWLAWLWMTSASVVALGFSKHGQTVELSTYATASERMKALQALARAADAPNDTPPGGGLPCPEPVAAPEPVASVAPTPTVAVSSASPTPPVAVSSDFQRVGNVRVDLVAMVAQGAKPESLIGLGVYYKGNMANPSGSGAITATENSEWYGLTVDVTLESGMVWRAVQAREFKTGSFSLDAKMHGAPYMAELAAKVAAIKASESASKEIAATAHAQALIDLAAQYPQLKRAENTYAGGKLAAANMRILLKAAFKGVKFSVTSDSNSVHVNWTDGPSDKQVNEVVGRFDIGASDSQSDYFYTVSTAFSQLFGGVQYLNTKREVSDSLIQVAIDRRYIDWAEKPTVTDYRNGKGVFEWGNDARDWHYRQMREMLETLGK